MGWSLQVRTVRDRGRSHGYRLRALASALEISRPLGFSATWTYLELRLGVDPEAPEFLEPAIDALADERVRSRAALRRHVDLRLAAKEEGRRQPVADGATPHRPLRWHGDERRGAGVLLGSLLDRPETQDLNARQESAAVLDLATRLARRLDAAEPRTVALDAGDRASLQAALVGARRDARPPRGPDAMPAYLRARTTQLLLEQILIAVDGAPPLGEPLTFVATPAGPPAGR
ncbi:hypothetical protein [Litorihabitans aurantiacus]|uniref:Uncharacterized protein n=1 Tax=Litorihabitans aurantiacus TaxID=1930061 RepID=A0AA37XHR1_9MICO|nr:hypothetical protein [Litorihabitans aurantiacus]GMA32795.1 hypothetical protein GCM10025875_27870 [Litorihabitans aurantiacus]